MNVHIIFACRQLQKIATFTLTGNRTDPCSFIRIMSLRSGMSCCHLNVLLWMSGVCNTEGKSWAVGNLAGSSTGNFSVVTLLLIYSQQGFQFQTGAVLGMRCNFNRIYTDIYNHSVCRKTCISLWLTLLYSQAIWYQLESNWYSH